MSTPLIARRNHERPVPARPALVRPKKALLTGVVALTVTLGLTGGAAAQTPKPPKRACGDYALVLQHIASVDNYDLNRDGWHCSGPLVPRPGGSDPVLFADNKPIPKPRRATKYFAGGFEFSGAHAWLSANTRKDKYTATVSVEEGDGPFDKTFRYDRSDHFYLNYGDASAAGGSRLVGLRIFEEALAAAASSRYYHPIRLDTYYSPKSARSSVFSLYTAPDESPAINDVATLRSGKVTEDGNVSVSMNLTCPKEDSFTASMVTLTIGSGAPDDIVSRNVGSETTGTCTGKRQTIELLLITEPIEGVLYPAPKNCSAEYGVGIDGPDQDDSSPGWMIRFDKGGADGGPDGPGPTLCLQ